MNVVDASDSFFDFFFEQPRNFQQPEATTGAGSGVIISTDGYIVTNNHVIDNAAEIEVTLNDKMVVLSSTYREDEQNDEKRVYLALPEHLAPIRFGRADDAS